MTYFEYLPLAMREGGKAIANRFGFISLLARQRIDLCRPQHCGKKRFAFDRLRQEIDCARLHRSDAGRHIALARQENYRSFRACLDQGLLQMQTIELGHHKVDNRTAGN